METFHHIVSLAISYLPPISDQTYELFSERVTIIETAFISAFITAYIAEFLIRYDDKDKREHDRLETEYYKMRLRDMKESRRKTEKEFYEMERINILFGKLK